MAEANRCNQKLIFTPKKLTVQSAFTKLREIATISGNSSQNKKCEMIKGLLVSCDPIEARYIMRILAGKLRNGPGELSILSALAHACATTHRTLDSDELVLSEEDTAGDLRVAAAVGLVSSLGFKSFVGEELSVSCFFLAF